jgi:hypothetical protein
VRMPSGRAASIVDRHITKDIAVLLALAVFFLHRDARFAVAARGGAVAPSKMVSGGDSAPGTTLSFWVLKDTTLPSPPYARTTNRAGRPAPDERRRTYWSGHDATMS